MDDTTPKAKYLVLDHAIPATYKERLLGCVVNDVIDPANGLQPDFQFPNEDDTPTKPGGLSPYEQLKVAMKGFLDEDPTGQDKVKNQVNLRDLLTERIVEGDVTVEGNLTKLLKGHYGHKEKRQFEIEAASGKRYHLHNATYQFKKALWSNKYYRDCIYEVIEQKRDDGTLETLRKVSKKYNSPKTTRHQCEVVVLPMIVGILTCEEIKVNIVDNKEDQHGAEVRLPVEQMAGLQLGGALDAGAGYDASKSRGNHTAETIPDEVIVAVSYDLIAISTGRPDTHDPSSTQPDSRGFLSKLFGGRQTPKFCEACESNKLPYPAAWRHLPIRTNNNRGANIHMTPSHKTTTNSSMDISISLLPPEFPEDDDYETDTPLETSPLELYCAPPSDRYILHEDLDARLSPSSTGSTTRSRESRRGGQPVELLSDQSREEDMNGRAQ